ncbi:MAG TPA: hypothetical protein EYG76_01385 [Methanothermococcus okinawensis]|uniref:Uncharacterized protein n=1 Tax=Methanothermococcus okinawensis TaxID=155863 RepID=A0A833DRA9_9EURY|nr:hypothetical protein [Methanothermococcus okinawensis]
MKSPTKIGITKMYRDIAENIGIKNYDIINPYNNKLKENYDLMIISKGYEKKVKRLNPYPIFEIISATFDDLIESINKLNKLNIGTPEKIKSYSEKINEKKEYIKSIKYNREIYVNPKCEFIKKIVVDLGIPISDRGIPIIPDYMTNKYNNCKNGINEINNIYNNYNNGLKLVLKTHKYELNTLKRIEDRYLSVINFINSL